jgi:ankyrin repeat protein
VQNIEGFSAIHFASFHGSYSMLTKLSEASADIKQVNNQGCNVLHMAA